MLVDLPLTSTANRYIENRNSKPYPRGMMFASTPQYHNVWMCLWYSRMDEPRRKKGFGPGGVNAYWKK